MKYFFVFFAIVIASGFGLYYYYINSPYSSGTKRTIFGKLESMTIQSSVFNRNGAIPSKYTCDTENISPPISFNAVTFGTKSLVLTMEDLDSPSKNFTHWVVFNIDPYSSGFNENYISDNVTLGKNDSGNVGYYGPCPQDGKVHRYIFKLFAIDTILSLQKGSTKEQLFENIKGHILDEAETTATYKKQ